MVFSSALFLFAFFPCFLICAFLANFSNQNIRNYVLITFSLLFYFFGGGLYTLILIGSIAFNWAYADQVIHRYRRPAFLFVGVVVNLLPLIIFKYASFMLETLNYSVLQPGFGYSLPLADLFLPVGISFYSFQAMSYLFDVQRGDIQPEKKLSVFSAYMLMFPQLVAGPIVRLSEIRSSFYSSKVTGIGLNAGLFFFGVGLAKKMLIADPIGAQVDLVYAMPANEITAFLAWYANIGYYLQIFFDFSGYSEMAIGIGLMLGFAFPENFRQPYRSTSITNFWRRWHITLSQWFRDYLYIPLGGNRAGTKRTLANLTIVFVLCGLWHGAAITFLIWGLFHGLLLVVERVLKRGLGVSPAGITGFFLTNILVIIGWVFFRSADFSQATMMLSKMFFMDTSATNIFGWSFFLTPYMSFIFVVGFVFALLPSETWNVRERILERSSLKAGYVGLGLVILASASLAAKGFNPFIYFQF